MVHVIRENFRRTFWRIWRDMACSEIAPEVAANRVFAPENRVFPQFSTATRDFNFLEIPLHVMLRQVFGKTHQLPRIQCDWFVPPCSTMVLSDSASECCESLQVTKQLEVMHQSDERTEPLSCKVVDFGIAFSLTQTVLQPAAVTYIQAYCDPSFMTPSMQE